MADILGSAPTAPVAPVDKVTTVPDYVTDTILRAVKIAGSSWGVTVLGLGLVGLLMIYRRWRHLLVFLGSLFVMQIVGGIVYDALTRPRPYGVAIISGWGGFAMPSPPVATLAAILIGITYTLLVAGRPRWY